MRLTAPVTPPSADDDAIDHEAEELYRLIDRILALCESDRAPLQVRATALVSAAGLATQRVAEHHPLMAVHLAFLLASWASDLAPGIVTVHGPRPGTH